MRKWMALVILATACKKEPINEPEILDITKFTKVENSSVLLSLKPTAVMDYAELRLSSGQGPMGAEIYTIRESVGNKMDLSGACLDLFEKLPAQEDGFAKGCRPLCYFHYIVTAENNKPKVYTDLSALHKFLGEIDSDGDAALLAFAYGYEFDYNNKDAAAVRKVNDGYEVLCKKLVRNCNPIQYNQLWLHISTKGTITIKQEVIYSTLDACI
jgi:hypothetical protein